MKKRTTITDVAQAAGVSLMTVSRVMNNRPGVGEEMRQRILTLAEDMNFRPNQLARGLATQQTSTIGIVVPDITNPFFAQIVRGAEDMAFEQGYHIFLINTAEDMDRELEAYDSLWQKAIDGVILCSARLALDELESSITRFPAVVLFNRELPAPIAHIATMNINDSLGAQLAVKHFVAQGRKRIALVGGPVSSVSAQRRMDGYRAALKDAKLIFDPVLLEHCAPTMEGGMAATRAIFARRAKIDAILAFNDLVAIGVIQACREAGKQVPEDIMVIGADDIPFATVMQPKLTTIRVDLLALGRMAMETLLTLIRGHEEQQPPRLLINPELVLRESA